MVCEIAIQCDGGSDLGVNLAMQCDLGSVLEGLQVAPLGSCSSMPPSVATGCHATALDRIACAFVSGVSSFGRLAAPPLPAVDVEAFRTVVADVEVRVQKLEGSLADVVVGVR